MADTDAYVPDRLIAYTAHRSALHGGPYVTDPRCQHPACAREKSEVTGPSVAEGSDG